MVSEEEKNKQNELEAYRALKKTRLSLLYDSMRHRLRADTSLSVGETFHTLNSLVEKRKLVRDPMLRPRLKVEPIPKKKSLRDLFPDSVLRDPDLKKALSGLYGIKERSDTKELGWDDFRNLLRYYIEILTVESQQYFFDYEKESIDFFNISLLPKWFRSSVFENNFECKFSTDKNNYPILLDAKNPISIGYPIEKRTLEDSSGQQHIQLIPIFYIPISKISVENGNLVLHAISDYPKINPTWFQQTFKAGVDQKYDFLLECGFTTDFFQKNYDDLLEDNESFESVVTSPKNWKELILALEARCSRKIKEKLDPDSLRLKVDFSLLENGIWNTALIGVSNTSNFVKSTIEELKQIEQCSDEDLNKTSLKYLFLHTDKEQDLNFVDKDFVLSSNKTVNLNELQKEAVSSFLSEPVTLLQGPPGTGKTQVITAAALNFRLHNQTALITSRNHQAISAIMDRYFFEGQNEGEARELITRFKDESGELFSFSKAKTEIENMSPSEDLDYRMQKKIIDSKYGQATANQKNFFINADLLYSKETTKELAELAFNKYFSKYKSNNLFKDTLIKNAKSNDLSNEIKLAIKRSEELHNSFYYLNPISYFRRFLIRKTIKKLGITEIISKKNLDEILFFLNSYGIVKEKYQSASELEEQYADFHKQLNLTDTEIYSLFEESKNEFLRCAEKFLKIDSQNRMNITKEQKKDFLDSFRFVHNIERFKFFDILKSEENKGYIELKKSLDLMLSKFPIISCSMLSMKRYFPFVPGLFDIVIFDEAGQSDFISAIPALFRAKRVAIVGDPQQLKPIQNISDNYDLLIRAKNMIDSDRLGNFSYYGRSLFSLGKFYPEAKSIMLEDSYRSCQQITSYISKIAYGGKVFAANHGDFLVPNGFPQGGIIWRNVQGEFLTENKSTYCPEEAKEVVKILKEIINTGFTGTIGVVSPFRSQVKTISNMCDSEPEICNALAQGSLLIDTVHKFQGSERDCIIFSLCFDINKNKNNFVTDKNLLNVAVSRAKGLFIVVGNQPGAAKSGIEDLMLLAIPEDLPEIRKYDYKNAGYDSPYEMIIGEELKNRGYKIICQYPLNNRRLDIALIEGEYKLDIEIDGYCHRGDLGYRKRDDYIRDIEVRNRNFSVIRLSTDEIRNDKEDCIKRIVDKWNSLLKGQKNE